MLATERNPEKKQPAVGSYDDHGRYLEDLLAEIQQALAERRAAEVARSVLDRLVRTTGTAFAREESLMLETGYSGLEAHRDQHRELAEQLLAFHARAADSNAAIGFELKIFLKAWLAQHVNETDRRFAAFMATLDEGKTGSGMTDKPWWQVW